MDLSGRGNMDLTEAARLLKQSTTTPTVANPAQMQPPPLMMMQQAVAMQQFQFQQALLMQQVMATQQAAARAATVKSAAEMAAARAAEISKQLKGSDAEDEEKKPPSPGRSKSRSASRSRSPSRSKSRSPIRYRRDRSRSLSRSPIRYRRERPYSPSRSRDHYSYRRGYYRGRGDYPWNSFRREWDRDRDRDYYPRSRRSRSRSRSRIRRRSRTRSRSPRFHRDRTPSPPRHRREERRSIRHSRRSRSMDHKRTPSISSRSPSASPHRKEICRSPGRKLHGNGASPARRGVNASPVARSGLQVGKELSVSPLTGTQMRSPDTKEKSESFVEKEVTVERGSFKESDLPIRELSRSPRRSLSVSFNHSLMKDLQSDDEMDVNSTVKKLPGDCARGEDAFGVNKGENAGSKPSLPSKDIKIRGTSSDISSEEQDVDAKPRDHFQAKQSKSMRGGDDSGKDSRALGQSDDDKELDDWRNDMKVQSMEKSRLKDEKRVSDRKVEEESKSVKMGYTTAHDRSKLDLGQEVRQNNRMSKKHVLEDSDHETDHLHEDQSRDMKLRTDAVRRERWQESHRDRGRSLGEEMEEGRQERGSERERHLGSDDKKEPGKQKASIPAKEVERLYSEDEYVNQGPQHNSEEDERVVATVRPLMVHGVKDLEREAEKVAGAHSKARDDSDVEDAEEVKVIQRKVLLEEDGVSVSRKGKEKSRSKDCRVDDEEERERRKERHKKHRKKHRREVDDEKDEDEEEKDDADGRKERRRHRRKHRKEDEDERRDRKKRKHRTRGKSVSDSGGDSPRADAGAKEDDDDSPIRKKSSSRHRKRRKEPSRSPANSGSSSEG